MLKTLVVLLAFAVLLFGETSLAYISGSLATLTFVISGNEDFLAAYPRRIFSQIDVFAFMALPLFILVGEIMNRGGVTVALINLAMSLVGRVRGGLGHVNILTSVFFAGISGAAVADAAALSNTLVPAMRKEGYSAAYAGAITAASAVIGPIIPPSIILIFYGAVVGVDVAALFAAGLVPGFLLAGCLFAANAYFAHTQGHPGGKSVERIPFTSTLPKAIPALALPIIIMIGIVLGWMTPTEAACVAVFAALGVSALYRTINRTMLREALWRTVTLSGAIFAMLAAAAVVNFLAALTQLPADLATLVASLQLEGVALLLVLTVVFFIFGMFSETQIAIVLAAPILAPIAVAQGIDPVHLGIIVCLNLAMGLITPPLGSVIVITSTTTGTPYWTLVRATLPFVLVEISLLLVLVIFPEITLSLPRALGFL